MYGVLIINILNFHVSHFHISTFSNQHIISPAKGTEITDRRGG